MCHSAITGIPYIQQVLDAGYLLIPGVIQDRNAITIYPLTTTNGLNLTRGFIKSS